MEADGDTLDAALTVDRSFAERGSRAIHSLNANAWRAPEAYLARTSADIARVHKTK